MPSCLAEPYFGVLRSSCETPPCVPIASDTGDPSNMGKEKLQVWGCCWQVSSVSDWGACLRMSRSIKLIAELADMAFCLLFIKSWSIAAPELQRQNCIITAETIWLTEPRVLLAWLFT